MVSKSFLKSSFIYSVIGALPLASSILLLPVYTNFLSTQDFGLLALFIAFTALLQIIVNFAIDNYIVINYYESKDNPDKIKKIVGTSVSLLLLYGLIIIVVSLLLGDLIFSLYAKASSKPIETHFFPYGFFCVLTAIFNSFFRTYTAFLIAQQKAAKFFWLNITNFVLTIAISLIGIYLFPFTLVGPMYGRLLSGVGIFILAFYFFITEYGILFEKSLLKEIYRFCFPLVINFIILWIVGYFDPFILDFFLNKSDVAIFSFILQATLLLEFFQNGLTSAISPKIYTLWNENKIQENTPEINKYFNGFTGISLLVIPLFVILIPILAPIIVYNPDYFYGFKFLLLISVGFAFRGIHNIFITPIMYLRKTKLLTKINVYTSIYQVIVSILFIKYWGLEGVFLARFVIKPFQTFIYYFVTNGLFHFHINFKKQLLIPITYTILAILLYRFYFIYDITILNAILLIFIWSLTFYIYKREIINLSKGILKKF